MSFLWPMIVVIAKLSALMKNDTHTLYPVVNKESVLHLMSASGYLSTLILSLSLPEAVFIYILNFINLHGLSFCERIIQ